MLKSKQTDREGNPLPEGKVNRPYIKLSGYNAKYLMERLAKLGPTDSLILKLEDKSFQLESIQEAVEKGFMKPENAEKAKERIEKIPDFVIFEIYDIQKV